MEATLKFNQFFEGNQYYSIMDERTETFFVCLDGLKPEYCETIEASNHFTTREEAREVLLKLDDKHHIVRVTQIVEII